MQTILYNESGIKVTSENRPYPIGKEYTVTYDGGEGFFTLGTEPILNEENLTTLINEYKILKCESEDDVDNLIMDELIN